MKVTGTGYNGEGDVLYGSERVTYDSHPGISKIVEVISFLFEFQSHMKMIFIRSAPFATMPRSFNLNFVANQPKALS